ncbi:pyrroline-5-carboxylate reductase [Rheinheimera mesophila]|uniref:Pyrroline-5-carboxylate reductase n=1 Tax=Rheinheimera mesophila TaxID=1547515 RepID=A0A3P3QFA8_9GAMM|nr:pyrroline-5-carboxylate reductase [Rheinheimera mesophila]KKL00745.1 pyrroline-5-carboxylate reductase [Rheinheimera mesophila]RRJ19811.1 pyrroline-5-carboxylate reductase [Rheinheimera mesophila]
MIDNTVAFIGAGNMAQCIIGAMIRQGYPAENIIAANRNAEKLKVLESQYQIATTTDNIEAVTKADVIVLAVKPQMMAEVCQQIIEQAPESQEKLFISVAAGISIERFEQLLGQVRIIRAMPNTPALVGLGVTGLFPSRCSVYEQSFAEKLFAGTGKTVWLQREQDINAIIAVTGSAPAYFFYFMQAMQQVALELGFDEAQAKAMVAQTALGAATMAGQSELSFEALRAQVTSKGGTTHEAIETFKHHKLESMVKDAMYAAIRRAEDMANTL